MPIPDRRAPDRPMRPPGRDVLARGPRRSRSRPGRRSPRPPAPRASRCPRAATPACAAATRSTCSRARTRCRPSATTRARRSCGSACPPHARLACSAEVHGDVTVSIAADAVAAARRRREPAAGRRAAAPVAAGRRRRAAAPRPGTGIERVVVRRQRHRRHHRRRLRPPARPVVLDRPRHRVGRTPSTTASPSRGSSTTAPGLRRMQLLPDSWYEAQRIEQWLNTSATRIDRARQRVLLGTGETLEYDRLILATGARATMPPLDGHRACPASSPSAAPATPSASAPTSRTSACRRAVIVGGGLLGLEAADALDQLEIDCTVVERGAVARQRRDRRAQRRAARSSSSRRAASRSSPASPSAPSTAAAAPRRVELADGRALAADVVIVCAGITPNVELARDAGLVVGRGVVVDEHDAHVRPRDLRLRRRRRGRAAPSPAAGPPPSRRARSPRSPRSAATAPSTRARSRRG